MSSPPFRKGERACQRNVNIAQITDRHYLNVAKLLTKRSFGTGKGSRRRFGSTIGYYWILILRQDDQGSQLPRHTDRAYL